MAVEIEPPSPPLCPSHYWLVEESGFLTQHWSCQRCGAEKDLDDPSSLRNRWPMRKGLHQPS
jgi:transposase-like protein